MINNDGTQISVEDALSERFTTWGESGWLLHSYDNYGHDEGFILRKKTNGDFELVTLSGSGYGSSTVIIPSIGYSQAWLIGMHFRPTNPDCKTSRK